MAEWDENTRRILKEEALSLFRRASVIEGKDDEASVAADELRGIASVLLGKVLASEKVT